MDGILRPEPRGQEGREGNELSLSQSVHSQTQPFRRCNLTVFIKIKKVEKTSNFGRLLDLQKSCKDNTEHCCIPLTQFPLILVSYSITTGFGKMKNSTLEHHYQPDSRLLSDAISFPTNVLFLFQGAKKGITWHLVHIFFN